jgi:hypothetical protein
VILATLEPNQELTYKAFPKGDIALAGDCLKVRRGLNAIQDGFRLGMRF